MNRLEQSRRDHQIAAAAASGISHAALARRYGLSERSIRRCVARVRTQDPVDHQRRADYHRAIEAAIEQLALERIAAGAPRTRIAAIRGQLDLMKERERLHLGAPAQRSVEIRQPEQFAAALVLEAMADGFDDGVVDWIRETSEKLLARAT